MRPFQLIGFLAILVLLCTAADDADYANFLKQVYEDQKWTVDRSAATICFVVDGKLEMVDPKKPDYGYTCDVELKTQTADKEHAEDMCESIFPHYIVEAEPKGTNTRCKFIILFKCLDNYYSIYEKCYITFEKPLTYEKSKEMCSTAQGNKTDPKLAEYTSSSLALDLVHMEFDDAWMRVPDMNEHFSNQQEEGGAVFVIESSWQYDTKEGSIQLQDPNSLHRPLCEYTPEKTMAYTMWVLGKFNQVTPELPTFTRTDRDGLSIQIADLCAPRDPRCIREMTRALGNIFNVPSSPPADIPDKYSGNFPLDIVLGVPRYGPGPCPDGWLKYVRENGQHICHLMEMKTGEVFDHDCHKYGAHQSGFDSADEVKAFLDKFGYDRYYVGIGGRIPCRQMGCNAKPKRIRKGVDEFNFGWENGVASNLDFLYDHMQDHYLKPYSGHHVVDLLAYRSSKTWDFWTHEWSGASSLACSKYADVQMVQ